MQNKIAIDISEICKSTSGQTAKLHDLDKYLNEILKAAGEGNEITLTGSAPIWLYLKAAHALHGKAKRLLYSSPGQGITDFEIFNHSPD
jgi:hypothetical protein